MILAGYGGGHRYGWMAFFAEFVGGKRAYYQSIGSQGEKAQAVQVQVAGVAVHFQFFQAATCPAS